MHIRLINVNGAFMSNNPKHIWMRKTEIRVVDVYYISILFHLIIKSFFFKFDSDRIYQRRDFILIQ